MKRLLVTALVSLSAAVGLISTAAPAEAAYRPAQVVSLYGDVLHSGGSCSGPVRIVTKTDPRKRGWVESDYIPGRFNRTCSLRIWSNYGTKLPGTNWSPRINVSRRGGAVVRQRQFIGSGVQGIQYGTGGPQVAVVHYLIIP
ncbi:MAG: hypothetical protein QM774_11170 [Gordonia sp. (in: high G+C Gram-positive bacteria)]|uniref:hypothetical protein n=1 Tax=Gordonia sp. (in: high G+C Gram-positive bacteria) TaxID=84139 RepID=UPI0039E41CC1